MRERKNWGRIAGLILHILVGGLMLFTGSEKVLGLVPAQALAKYGLGERLPTPHSAHVFTRHLANEFILGRRDLHPHGLRRALSCASGTAWDVVGPRVSPQPRNARQIFRARAQKHARRRQCRNRSCGEPARDSVSARSSATTRGWCLHLGECNYRWINISERSLSCQQRRE